MPLEKVSTILQDADAHSYGAASFNIFNYETIAWLIQVGEEERIPVIVMLYSSILSYIPISTAAAITMDLASKSSMPVGLHLDHSSTFETALSGARFGYPSIMIDGSYLSFDENVRLTREVVKAAHAMGVEVEAELGHVGSGANPEDFLNKDLFTQPVKAMEFIERTGADSLAVAIGNGHGNNVKAPSLNFDRLKELDDCMDVPLVLHGGSYIPDAQIERAVRLGMNKINIGREYGQSFYNSIEDTVRGGAAKENALGCMKLCETQVKEFLRKKIRVLNPDGYHL